MRWLGENLGLVGRLSLAHLSMTLPAVALSFLFALPVAWLATRWRPGRAGLVALSGLVYAIPSLPLFVVLPMLIGTTVRDRWNVIAALTLYGFALMVRSATDGLDAVGDGPRLSAMAMGYGALRRFVTVELPLAGPALLAGLRVVAVSTVSLVTVSALLGVASLGQLFTDGFQRGILAEVLTGILATVLVAWLLDALLQALGWLLLPWTRRQKGAAT
ncbi:osmoprotectant transport system permease protein [Luteococcus japonicus]|uniref:Osmoprotectant transport system permease protein n=1 Tax=Luteococcus japonicus TaxID=33984 RepID=A0A3N1ZWI9_9ACTN|nr:ABC transporter permease subunit [Luteococcus japonicus]ROR55221.1 osmoprotectant transport system permease protein [Luteococcus japonicus]